MTVLEILRNKLVIAAYAILIFVAIVCSFIAACWTESSIARTILYGIASNCIFTTLVYTILNFFMADPNKIIKEEMTQNNDKLIQTINRTNKDVIKKIQAVIDITSPKSHELNEYKALDNFFSGIKDKEITNLDLVGYCMTHIFQHHQQDLVNLLDKDVKIRVMIIDPNSAAGEFMKAHVNQGPENGDPYVRSSILIEQINNNQTNNRKTNLIQFIPMDWVPCGAILMAHNNTNYFSLLFGINGFSLKKIPDRRLYVLETTESKSAKFSFLSNHYEELWTLSEKRKEQIEKQSK